MVCFLFKTHIVKRRYIRTSCKQVFQISALWFLKYIKSSALKLPLDSSSSSSPPPWPLGGLPGSALSPEVYQAVGRFRDGPEGPDRRVADRERGRLSAPPFLVVVVVVVAAQVDHLSGLSGGEMRFSVQLCQPLFLPGDGDGRGLL